MTTDITRSILLVLGLWGMIGSISFCRADSFKAFSLREANRRVVEGRTDAPGLADLGGITRVVGMVFDRDTNDVILVGKARGDMPSASLDDLVVALRSRLGKGQYPKVSIDVVEDTAATGMQHVRFEGGIEKTHFGGDFLDSDVVLKLYSLDLLRSVQGVQPYLKLFEADIIKEMAAAEQPVEQVDWLSDEESTKAIDRYVGKTASEDKTVQSRFWYYVDDEESFIVEQDDVYVIEELRLGVKAETIQYRDSNDPNRNEEEKRDLVGEEFAKQFSDNFWQISDENPVLRRLKVLFDLVCITEGIARLNQERPNLDGLLRDYRVAALDTPERYRLVQRVGEFRGQGGVAQLVQLSGGIDMEALLLALDDGDVSALKMAVLQSRPDVQTLCWDLPLDEWRMPNDLPPPASRDNAKTDAKTKIQPQDLGFTLTLQRVTFDPQSTDGTGQAFRGFSPPQAVAPILIPDPVIRRLRQLAPHAPPRLAGPAPMPEPVRDKFNQVRWNLVLPDTPGHTGKVAMLPTGQLHDGPGSATAASASYHWHPLDRRTGIHSAIAIPLDRSLKPVGAVPATETDAVPQEYLPPSLREPLQHALATGDWKQVAQAIAASPEALLYPVPRLAYAHAMLALNRANEATALNASVTQKHALVAWADFARDFAETHVGHPVADYLWGDSHARFGNWDQAEAKFRAAVERDPRSYLPISALAVVHFAQGKRSEALVALTDATRRFPAFADGFTNLGNLYIGQRAPEGAAAAFEKALALDRTSALALIGSGISSYGLGQWNASTRLFEQAAQCPIAPVWDAARHNHLNVLQAQRDFYANANPLDPSDLLPAQPSRPGGTTQALGPSHAADPVAEYARQPYRSTRQRAAAYQPPASVNPNWTAADQSYRQQIDVMRRQVEVNQQRWETQVRRQQADIGGITMNMQKALADSGDWPVGTFFALGYFDIPTARPRANSGPHPQNGQYAPQDSTNAKR